MKFFKELQKRIFPTIIALSAVSVSASAAFYSISGLSKLFAGASQEVIIMATSLEIAKLVIASLLYQYWGRINKLLKTYLSIAAIVLVFITSAGIYGFLSAAYQETSTKLQIVDSQVSVLEMKKARFEETKNLYLTEKEQLDNGISELRKGLSNNIIQYKDSETGQIITTTSSTTRRVLESQIDEAVERRNQISKNLESVIDSISSLDTRILDIGTNVELSGELGPLKYLSNLTNMSMDKIINILLLVIIFVFDPLAISLVIAANFAFDQLRKNKSALNSEKPYLKDKDIEIDNNPKKESEVENDVVKEESKISNSSDDLVKKLEKELEKLTNKNQEDEKTLILTTDFINKVNKLSEVIELEDKEEIKDEQTSEIKEDIKSEVSTTPNKKRITYRRRDEGRGIRTERI